MSETTLQTAKRIIEEFADGYDHEVNDEMGDTWCRFCDNSGPDLRYTPPVHSISCIVLEARRLRNSKTFARLVGDL